MRKSIHELAVRIEDAAERVAHEKAVLTHFIERDKDFMISVSNDDVNRTVLLGDVGKPSSFGYILLYDETATEPGKFQTYPEFPAAHEMEKWLACVLEGKNLEKQGFPCAGYRHSREMDTASLQKKIASNLSKYLKKQENCR